MRIALAQLNPTIGDIAGNARLVLEAIDRARADGADLVVTSELVLIGYPPRDLLFREGVVEACEAAVKEIARAAGDMTVLVGHPRIAAGGIRPFRNSISAVSNGMVLATYDKRLLPGYDVFDEDRYFDSGERPCVIDVGGTRVGLLLCEDMWRAQDVTAKRRYPCEPAAETVRAGARMLAVLNGSPFVAGKWSRHMEQISQAASSLKVPIISVNQVGANDDLIFDGRSTMMDSNGRVIHRCPGWIESIEVVNSTLDASGLKSGGAGVHAMEETFHALVLGIRDYCRKTRNPRCHVGLSGGIDSALTAVLAAAAVGAKNVTGVLMPSRYTAAMSREDALALAENLGLGQCVEIPIPAMHDAASSTLRKPLGERLAGVVDENMQSRLRGVIIMALSNAAGGIVLATGNKSELATGYCTIYGDMCGALAVLGDVLKTRVYELSRWINSHYAACGFAQAPIPPRSISRPPTAELKPDQTDQDTLPPYEVLDQIVEGWIEREESIDAIVQRTGLERGLVDRWAKTIDRYQYKRDQAALVLKVTGRTFGRGRPMPIAMRS